MKDPDIRKILIEYIKTIHKKEIRIFQEKSIGNSICDVMLVDDKLTGFEIKSDVDNYTRLESQIKSYERFFDENYIVVSSAHERSAEEKVPSTWGILCITDDNIVKVRSARKNGMVSRRSQLSILWKLELQNLLAKNNLPVYAQKEKGFIADRIAEKVDKDDLQKQIATELLRRDYSIYNAKDYSVKIGAAVDNLPAVEIIDALSEENLSDMTLDQWIAIYRRAKEIKECKESLYSAEVKERKPHEIPFDDIEIVLGAPYIPVEIIDDFAHYLCGDAWDVKETLVEYMDYTGTWHVSYARTKDAYLNERLIYRYGTRRFNGLQILDAILNLREIKVNDANGVFSEKETVAALAKKKVIEEEFKSWLGSDEDRKWIVEEEYNKTFGTFNKVDYNGSKLSFNDMNPDFKLFDYQKDAVQKIISSKNTLLAFDVGAGKTFIMIAAAMLMRKDGISRKNVFVVPNNIVGQWAKIFSNLYPQAKILAVEPKTFKPEMRERVLNQIKKEDYDGIIIAYSCFEMIPISRQEIINDMDSKLAKITDMMKSYRYNMFQIREMEQEAASIRQEVQDFLKSAVKMPQGQISFEELGINTIFLDEAHNYKNFPIKTKLKNLNGINTAGSKKCYDMMMKIRIVQKQNEGRGAVFATGTPLCNSIADTYVMQMYLQPEEMEATKLQIFDNWVRLFAKPEQSLEVDVDTSKFRIIRRFSRFFNLPQLSKMFSQVAVFYAVKNQDCLPVLSAYSDIVIGKNQALQDYMQKLCERTELIRTQKVARSADNMLKVSTDGRKAALSLYLVGKEQLYDEFSKVKRCIDEVMKIYHEVPGCSQLIFCDYSTPKNGKYNVYADIRTHLIEEGVPKGEIAFIHSATTEGAKLALFDKVNSGKVRVLIGSTFKLGIGANVQTKLKAIHHLDVPWRPADMVQREGRIIRQGNENKEIKIYRYIAEGSFDAYLWQILETKQKFISQFLEGSAYQKSVSDLENSVLSYAEVKALALSQPFMKLLAETENELKNLKMLKSQEAEAKEKLKSQIIMDRDTRTKTRVFVWNMATDVKKFSSMKRVDIFKKLKNITEPINEETLLSHSDTGLECKALNISLYIKTSQSPSETESEKKLIRIHSKESDLNYYVELDKEDHENRLAVARTLKNLDKLSSEFQSKYLNLSKRIQDGEDDLKKESDYDIQIIECQERFNQLREMVKKDEKARLAQKTTSLAREMTEAEEEFGKWFEIK